MPQFDTFSFFSQIFWVFFSFSFLYLLVCFYLLPALSITLKIRKCKLSKASSSTNLFNVKNNNNILILITKKLNDTFTLNLRNSKIANDNKTLQNNVSTASFYYTNFRGFSLRVLYSINMSTIF